MLRDLIPAECAARSVLARHEQDIDRVGHTLRNHADRIAEIELHMTHSGERLRTVEQDQHAAHRDSVALGVKLDAVETQQGAILAAVRGLEATTDERHRLLVEHINGSLLTREQDMQTRLTRHEQRVKLAVRLAGAATAAAVASWLLYRALSGAPVLGGGG